MSRQRIDADECTRRRLAHAASIEAHPLSPADIDRWLLSLGGLNDYDGLREQLRLCEEMLEHASEDEMLASDRTILVGVIPRLQRALDALPDALRVHRRIDYCRSVAMLMVGESFDLLTD